ncbi:hypothetical protein JXJ21_14490 [candidate division KSB1 bacterium]|nr:hypothetical protein [candidate division KSB1 bacterium]
MNRKFIILSLLMLLVLISGCFEYEDVITIEKDYSGTLSVHYRSLKDSNMNWNGMKFPKEKESILEEVKKNYTSEHVKLIRFRVKERDKYQHVYFDVKFDRLTDLNEIRQFADSHISLAKLNSNVIHFKRVIEFDEDEKDEDDESELSRLVISLLEESIFDKIKFRFEVNFPEEMHHTNANWEQDSRHGVWKYTLSDFIGDKKIVMTAQSK